MNITREQSDSIVAFVRKVVRSKADFIVTPTGTISVEQHIWDWLTETAASRAAASGMEDDSPTPQ